MPICSFIALSIVLVLSVAIGLHILKRLRRPRGKPKRRSRFGFYPVAAGNALQALQAIVRPSAQHTMELRFENQSDEDDASDPNGPLLHLHRQAAKIRRGEPIDRLTVLLPRSPSNPDPRS